MLIFHQNISRIFRTCKVFLGYVRVCETLKIELYYILGSRFRMSVVSKFSLQNYPLIFLFLDKKKIKKIDNLILLFATSRYICNVIEQDTSPLTSRENKLKACIHYFLTNLYLSPSDSPSKTMKDGFYFI